MNKNQWTALGVVLGLVAVTALLLGRVSAGQRLGEPGLKLGAEPTYLTNGVVARTESVALPERILDCTSEPVGLSLLENDWLPKDTLFGRRVYQSTKDGFYALLSVVLMGTDRTSIHKPQYCLDGQGWRIEKTESVVIPMQRPFPYDLRVMKLTTSKPATYDGRPVKWSGIYVYWFVADDQLTPFHGQRMWWMARDLIRTGVLQRWAYVTYFTTCPPGHEDAVFNRLKELIIASVPEFQLAAGEPKSTVSSTAMLPATPGALGDPQNLAR